MMKFEKLQNNVRNPLGIIAMFVSFAYVSMVVSFTIGIDKLYGEYERLPIIYFLILFPIIILAVFCWLIVGHTWKLYSPVEYSDTEILSLMSGKEIDKKQKEKVAESTALITNNKKQTSYCFMSTGQQYGLIQLKAVEKLSKILNVHFTENVKAKLANGTRIEFDAVGQGKYGTYYIECKYLPAKPSQLWLEVQSKQLRAKADFVRHRNESYRLFLVIVTAGPVDKEEIQNYYIKNNSDVTVYIFNQSELQSQSKL